LHTAKISHLGLLVLAGVFVLLVLLLWSKIVISQSTLGQCLSTKGVTMYGVDTCENCMLQKQLFGEDFKNVHYINCDFHKQECHEKGIRFYPVWTLDNRILVGTQSLPALMEFSGCKESTLPTS